MSATVFGAPRTTRRAQAGLAQPSHPRDERAALLPYAERPIAFLLRYVMLHRAAHAVVLAAVLAAVGCSVGSQYAVKHLVDTLAAGPGAGGAPWMALGVLATIVAGDNLLWRLGGWIAADSFTRVTGDLRSDLFHHLSGHAPDYFAERSPGLMAGRISATANAAWTVLSTITWNALPPMVAVLVANAFLAGVDPVMAGVLFTVAAGMAALLTWAAGRGRDLHQDYAAKAAAVDGELVDVVQNIGLVRAFGATIRERQRFGTTVGQEVASRKRSLRYLEKLRLAHAVATVALTVGLLCWALLLWQAGRATTGDVVMACGLGFVILHGTRDLAVALVELTQHVARLSEAVKALLVPHALADREDAAPIRPRGGAVAFQDVSFAYPGTGHVLRHFDLSIAAGERVGLVGRSGSGKSTALALLQRLGAPGSGRILIDGQDIAGATQASLAAALAVVPQDVSLFQRSVLENIRYGRPDATDAEVMRAAEAAHCREFIEALPQGFRTEVGQRGARLSGGQRQRLAIARALLKDAPILLLDEATSALDTESEEAVQAALERLMRGRTVIAVAHRLSTLRGFDRIVVVGEGQVREQGSPAELAARPGPWRALLEVPEAVA
ncbi:ABC transporter ATP-binding protein [Pararoseomonas sp. SCSIO 73927]|uniref:ABC transporter ATP-binding protein n=1 Tax=Pararoseomonas sp. SCSIO 73927 TaxID=3114537 RepID=UPI0030D01A02